jgi:hypothetical protein
MPRGLKGSARVKCEVGRKRSVTAICQPRRFAAVYWHELQRKPSRYESPTDNR